MQNTGIVPDEYSKYSKSFLLPRGASSLEKAGVAWDCFVLGAATLLPVILYIHRLGIYADDWGFFARFRADHDKTVADLLRTFYSFPRTRSRPIMELYEALLFRLFGTHYLGYHLVNTLVSFASALLLYLALRLLLRQRFVALAVPVIFVLLPNYSGARFAPCAFMIGLSMAFLFLNLYAMLKAAENAELAVGWTCVSVFALIISGLAYEIALPLFGLNLLGTWAFDRGKPVSHHLRLRSLVLLSVSNAAALLAVIVFKRLSTVRYHGLASAGPVIRGALRIHFYQFGLRLPIVAAKAILIYWSPALVCLAVLFGVFVLWYLWRVQRSSTENLWELKKALGLTGFGFLVFATGQVIFLVSAGETGFTATGFESRTAIAASLGMAFIFPGAAMCLDALVRAPRGFVASMLIAILCVCELLATSTIGSFWAAAAERQQLVLNSIQQDASMMQPHSVLLLDGVCPYIGPGIVFEGGSDMSGALQLLYNDPTLHGDVVSSRLQVHLWGIETRIYRHFRYYPYSPDLKVYDLRRHKMWNLPDLAAAHEYFGMMGRAHTFCPEGNEGDGVSIF